MQDATVEEARALLAPGSICEDAPDWLASENRPWHRSVEHGLLRADGTRAGLILTVDFVFSQRTQITKFQFGIYRGLVGGRQRVYQLTINQARKPLKDRHAWSHEHYGDERTTCPDGCDAWTFEQLLAYFCERTNLSIRPPIEDPATFRLKP